MVFLKILQKSQENTYADISFLKTYSEVSELLATESPLKIMKNTFHFILKAVFVFILTFFSCLKTV